MSFRDNIRNLLTEASKQKLAAYVKKAGQDNFKQGVSSKKLTDSQGRNIRDASHDEIDKAQKQNRKRNEGIKKAVDKLSGSAKVNASDNPNYGKPKTAATKPAVSSTVKWTPEKPTTYTPKEHWRGEGSHSETGKKHTAYNVHHKGVHIGSVESSIHTEYKKVPGSRLIHGQTHHNVWHYKPHTDILKKLKEKDPNYFHRTSDAWSHKQGYAVDKLIDHAKKAGVVD